VTAINEYKWLDQSLVFTAWDEKEKKKEENE